MTVDCLITLRKQYMGHCLDLIEKWIRILCGLIVCNFIKKDRTRSKTKDAAHDEVDKWHNIGRKQASHILAQR